MRRYFLCSQNKDSINNRFIQLLISDFVAAEFPKTPSPKPARIHSPDPFLRAGKFSRGFAKSFSPENSFGKTESALVPPPAQKLLGQNTKEKCPFLFRRNWSRANPKSKEHFSLVSAEALRGGGGADSFVQFPLEIGSSKVYNYSTNIMFSEKEKGFTLIELLVVIGIIGLISSITLVSLRDSREKGKVANAGGTARNLRLATELYYADMGFYPPDVNRGWDPGFTHPLPYNPDTDQTTTPTCPHCPSNWTDIVSQKWSGPYISFWPQLTLWGGKYDFNYWDAGANRYGCIVAPGIYIGVQGDYNNLHTIPAYAEQLMIDQQYDSDGCLNGESQMILIDL